MMITIKELTADLDRLYPPSSAEEWDNCGFLAGDGDDKLTGILIALDVTEEVIAEAVGLQCNFILTHHPLLYRPQKQIVNEKGTGALIYQLIKYGISTYAAHTNLDGDPLGTAYALIRTLNLPVTHHWNRYEDSLYYYILELDQEIPFPTFYTLLQDALELQATRYIGSNPEKISKAGIFCGSFDEPIKKVYNSKVDILLTGDLKYHTAMDLFMNGIFTLDIGHFASEKPVLRLMYDRVKKLLSDNPDQTEPIVQIAKSQRDPFSFM